MVGAAYIVHDVSLNPVLARKDEKVVADLQVHKEKLAQVAAELTQLKESDVSTHLSLRLGDCTDIA